MGNVLVTVLFGFVYAPITVSIAILAFMLMDNITQLQKQRYYYEPSTKRKLVGYGKLFGLSVIGVISFVNLFVGIRNSGRVLGVGMARFIPAWLHFVFFLTTIVAVAMNVLETVVYDLNKMENFFIWTKERTKTLTFVSLISVSYLVLYMMFSNIKTFSKTAIIFVAFQMLAGTFTSGIVF